MSDLQNCCSNKHLSIAPLCFLLFSFHLQIAYRKVQIGVDKLVGKVSIDLSCHAKFITSCKVNHLFNKV